MMMRTPLAFCLLSLGFTLFTPGCQSTVEAPVWSTYPELISGRWELVTAFRNERETQTLDGTFFSFSKEQSMSTNLPVPVSEHSGSPMFVAKYSFSQDTIRVLGQVPLQFIIQRLDSQYLVLATTINQQNFRFDLSRN
ncbi:MAG: hypothetical protein K9I85_09745 [Saprospiraceae bacterium]|nr:hypothetical protein [Saprospiraceae bacterium]